MKLNNQIYSDEFISKKIYDKYSSTEYAFSENRFLNIIINQSTEKLSDVYKSFIENLSENNFQILSQFFFGNEFQEKENKDFFDKHFKKLTWPITSIRQSGKTWGAIITAIESNSLKNIYHDESVIGNVYYDKYAAYCYLGGMMPKSKILSKDLATKSIFNLIETELNNVEMNFKNVVRTWFYLDELLKWYDEFNIVRNDYFDKKGIFKTMIPASTGIGAKNFNDSLLQSAAFSLKPASEQIKIFSVDSPFQCPASNYKSSFSRAVEIDHPDYRHLIISGTASINSYGQSENVDNVYNQIDLTMNVVYGILKSRDFIWENVIKGIVYFKDLNYMQYFNNYCREKSISILPFAMLQADICREELLFEIEVDAIELKK